MGDGNRRQRWERVRERAIDRADQAAKMAAWAAARRREAGERICPERGSADDRARRAREFAERAGWAAAQAARHAAQAAQFAAAYRRLTAERAAGYRSSVEDRQLATAAEYVVAVR